ncbi:peroxide stress protein YaaA [Klugiella xanthotipulae]
MSAVTELAADRDECIRVLKLGPQQHAEVDRNRSLASSPTMLALDRYTGVLYDAIDSDDLTVEQRVFAAEHVFIHSALWGIISAENPIPAYRLSYNSRVPALGTSLTRFWQAQVSAVLDDWSGLTLDLRSQGYRGLGPLTPRSGVVEVDVMTRGEDGALRALNHFNKKAKGMLVGALIRSGHNYQRLGDLVDDLVDQGHEACAVSRSRLHLIVAEPQKVSSK